MTECVECEVGNGMNRESGKRIESESGKRMETEIGKKMKEPVENQVRMKEMQKKGMKRDWMMLGITIIATAILLSFFPEKRDPVTATSWDLFAEMMMILPAVIIMMGLFSVWIQKELIVTHLGKTSGVKGIFLSLFLGALPTGPLYVAFPIAAGLLKKGARTSNVIVFLSAWACIKIPQEIVELQFLGLEFMLLRLFLTIFLVIIMGVSIEKIMEWTDKGNDGGTDKGKDEGTDKGKDEGTDKGKDEGTDNMKDGIESTEAIQHGS